jgi:hypothetical protein
MGAANHKGRGRTTSTQSNASTTIVNQSQNQNQYNPPITTTSTPTAKKELKDYSGIWLARWKIAHESKNENGLVEDSSCSKHLLKELTFVKSMKAILQSENYESSLKGGMKDISTHIISATPTVRSLFTLSQVCRDYYLLSIQSPVWKKFYINDMKLDKDKRNTSVLKNYREEIAWKWRYLFYQILNRFLVCVALYDFIGEDETELNLIMGDYYIVLDRYEPDGWWDAQDIFTGKKGLIPSNYVSLDTELFSNKVYSFISKKETAEEKEFNKKVAQLIADLNA